MRGDEDEAEGERCRGARRNLNKSHRCCDPRPNQCKTVEPRARGREKGGVRARAKPSGKCRTIHSADMDLRDLLRIKRSIKLIIKKVVQLVEGVQTLTVNKCVKCLFFNLQRYNRVRKAKSSHTY